MLEYIIFPITGNNGSSVEFQNNITNKNLKIRERERQREHFIIWL